MAILKLETNRLGPVTEIREYLQAVETAYNHLYAFHLIVREVKQMADADEPSSWRSAGRTRRKRTVRKVARPESVVLPEDRLTLHAVAAASPGVWEFLGSLNPLETLRKYLQDRHERSKDKQFRNQLEAERLMLENQRLKTGVVGEQVELLRRLGVSEDKIRQVLMTHVAVPLERLDHQQDRGLIAGAAVVGELRDGEQGSE